MQGPLERLGRDTADLLQGPLERLGRDTADLLQGPLLYLVEMGGEMLEAWLLTELPAHKTVIILTEFGINMVSLQLYIGIDEFTPQ